MLRLLYAGGASDSDDGNERMTMTICRILYCFCIFPSTLMGLGPGRNCLYKRKPNSHNFVVRDGAFDNDIFSIFSFWLRNVNWSSV